MVSRAAARWAVMAFAGVPGCFLTSLDDLSEGETAGVAGADAGTDGAGAQGGSAPDPCPANTKPCGDECVSLSDPATGCAAASCEPCNPPNALSPSCQSGVCSTGGCKPGFTDCNGQ